MSIMSFAISWRIQRMSKTWRSLALLSRRWATRCQVFPSKPCKALWWMQAAKWCRWTRVPFGTNTIENSPVEFVASCVAYRAWKHQVNSLEVVDHQRAHRGFQGWNIFREILTDHQRFWPVPIVISIRKQTNGTALVDPFALNWAQEHSLGLSRVLRGRWYSHSDRRARAKRLHGLVSKNRLS